MWLCCRWCIFNSGKKKVRIFHLLNIFDKSNPNKIKKNKIKADINEVAINFIRRYGLLGALFACPDSTFWGTFILIGRSMKNKIHQTRIKIRT